MIQKRFRIFKVGVNKTAKGSVLFDEQAASLVMQAYKEHGAKVMIDLEHLSVDDQAPNYDPDARGWCTLEIINGELWATNVDWTPDGKARLLESRQRYISPAFIVDKETRRVQSVFNVALVAMPATHGAQDLLAASRFSRLEKASEKPLDSLTLKVDCMPPELLQLLGLAPEATAEDVVAALKVVLSKVNAAPPEAAPPADHAQRMSLLHAQIVALTHRAEAGDKAIKTLKEIEDRAKEAKKTELLSKLPKHLETWGAIQSIESLETFLKHSAPVEPAAEPEKGGSEIVLTKAELAACKATGTSPEKLLKFKKENTQNG